MAPVGGDDGTARRDPGAHPGRRGRRSGSGSARVVFAGRTSTPSPWPARSSTTSRRRAPCSPPRSSRPPPRVSDGQAAARGRTIRDVRRSLDDRLDLPDAVFRGYEGDDQLLAEARATTRRRWTSCATRSRGSSRRGSTSHWVSGITSITDSPETWVSGSSRSRRVGDAGSRLRRPGRPTRTSRTRGGGLRPPR